MDVSLFIAQNNFLSVIFLYLIFHVFLLYRVYDGYTLDPKPLASVSLPRRVPYGFHATFVPQAELEKQNCPTTLQQ